MASGNAFDLNSSWMATLVYEDNKWQLISFASSTNAFDNPVIDGFFNVANGMVSRHRVADRCRPHAVVPSKKENRLGCLFGGFITL